MSAEQSYRRDRRPLLSTYHYQLVGTIALLYVAAFLLTRLYVIRPFLFYPFWLPSGVLLAALLLIDRRLWSTTLAVVFPTVVLSYIITGIALGTSFVLAFANCLEVGVAALLITRYVGLPVMLQRLQEVVNFACWVTFSVLMTGIPVAALASLFLDRPFWQTWLMWSSGNCLSILLVSSVILTWAESIKDGETLLPQRKVEFFLLYGSTIAITLVVFVGSSTIFNYTYQVLPFFLWAALRFGARHTTMLTFLMSFIMFWGTISGHGPFYVAGQPLWTEVFTTQCFILVILLSKLVIAAIMNERHQAKEALKLAYADLEMRVIKRTAELTATNERLQQEIADRQRAEAFLDTILQQMPSGVFIVEAPSGHVTLLNAEAQRLLGDPIEHIDSLDDYAQYGGIHSNGRLYEATDYPITRALVNQETVHGEDLLYRHSDGTTSIFSVNAAPVHDAAGRPIAAVCTFHNISERIRTEQSLRESRQQMQAILDHAPALIALKDVEGRYQLINRQFASLFKQDISRFIGHTDQELFPPEVAEKGSKYHGRVLDQKSPLEVEEIIFHEDGPHTYRSIFFPLTGETGEPYAVCCIAMDITEHKKLEAQLAHSQKMESIGLLAGGVAHDFNNLLTAISGYTNLALESVSPASETYDDLLEIMKATDRATALTRQLLTFARRQQIVPKIIDLNLLIADLDKMLQRLISEDITLTITFHSDTTPIKADSGQIEQVVVNLVINARDAMPTGGKLSIETRNVMLGPHAPYEQLDLPPGDYVMLSVEDTGVGMTPGIQRHVFEPLFTTKEYGKGTGLGLSTCYGIVKEHGGAITVASEQGVGTTMRVFLPYASEGLTATRRESEKEMPKGSETVLVVEDEATVRSLITRVLHSCGYTVLEASNGVEALRIAGAHQTAIDLLLTDVVMPEMGGKDTARQLTALYPGIRVIYMSGYAEHAALEESYLEEENMLLQKPLAPLTVAQAARKALDDGIALEFGAGS